MIGMNNRFIHLNKLYQNLDLEIFVFITLLVLIAFLFYKLFLRDVSEERHQNIRNHLKILLKQYILVSILFTSFTAGLQASDTFDAISRILPYIGFITFVSGAYCFIKASRLLVLQYLFLGSMRAGVPLLIVNIFTLIQSIILILWTFTNIFGVEIGPLLATSAAFSIILGLALQDTLGNLFAGISMQVDKNFEIGDWLEVVNGSSKIVGQVKEISWRSTVLIGFSDEVITVPNKLIAQCQVSNFSPEGKTIIRGHNFKFGFNSDINKITELLELAATQISEVKPNPAPYAYVRETNEQGCEIRLIYSVDNYGHQYVTGHKVITTALEILEKHGIKIAKPVVDIHQI